MSGSALAQRELASPVRPAHGHQLIVMAFAEFRQRSEAGDDLDFEDAIPNFAMKRAFLSQDQLASFQAEMKSSGIYRRLNDATRENHLTDSARQGEPDGPAGRARATLPIDD